MHTMVYVFIFIHPIIVPTIRCNILTLQIRSLFNVDLFESLLLNYNVKLHRHLNESLQTCIR